MPKLYVMCGLAFSGKSTLTRMLAEQTGFDVVAFDKLWVEREAEGPMPQGAEGWRYVRELAQKKIAALLKAGHSVVYDDNNPRREHRDEFKSVAKEAGVEAIVIYLDTPLDVIRSREVANRITQDRHDVASENFEKVLSDMEAPTTDENVLVFAPNTDVDSFYKQLS